MLEYLGVAEYIPHILAVVGASSALLTAVDYIAGVTETDSDDQLVREGRDVLAKVRKVLKVLGIRSK